MSETNDQMAPDTSPGEVSKKTGVRRVNNVPMYLLGGVLGLFLLVMALVAADRAAKQNEPEAGAKERAGNTSMFAKEIAGEQTGGMIEPAICRSRTQIARNPRPISSAKRPSRNWNRMRRAPATAR